MADAPKLDTLIKNVQVVRPGATRVEAADIAVSGGKIARVAPGIDAGSARAVIDGRGRLAFPGVVDAHMHTGIYSPMQEDAVTESRAAAQGGVTSSLNYFRSGQYYLNKSGPFSSLVPEVLALTEGRFHVDYGFHLAPVDNGQIAEMDDMVAKHGITSFKIYMFYGGYGLHGASDDQRAFLMIGPEDHYDLAHFEFVMRGAQRAMQRFPQLADEISVSLHCETAEIMRAYTAMVKRDGSLKGLKAYSAARPPHSEGLAICIASYLAHETQCPNINLLHLTSAKAVEAAMLMAGTFPHVNFRREVTIGHLMLDYDSHAGCHAKVNPPIRSRADVEALWSALLAGHIDWVCSDHACCRHEMKVKGPKDSDIFLAKSGFGGTEYLLPALVGEARRRGLSMNRVAELTALAPARRFGLRTKGDLAPGFDADVVLVNPDRSFVVHAEDSESTQGYTPFEGLELGATVETTLLRGDVIYDQGQVVGPPRGRYLSRPYSG